MQGYKTPLGCGERIQIPMAFEIKITGALKGIKKG
jgi:hypothetical protein